MRGAPPGLSALQLFTANLARYRGQDRSRRTGTSPKGNFTVKVIMGVGAIGKESNSDQTRPDPAAWMPKKSRTIKTDCFSVPTFPLLGALPVGKGQGQS